MKIEIFALCFIFLSIVSAKSFTTKENSKSENKKHDQKITPKMRTKDDCDYLYEDCDSKPDDYEDRNTGKIETKEEINNQVKLLFDKNTQESDNNNKQDKQSIVDSLENFNYDDFTTIRPLNGLGKFSVNLRQDGTSSTLACWFDGKPEIQTLPPFIELCKGKARCRMPFEAEKEKK